jgi:hypothetical protein
MSFDKEVSGRSNLRVDSHNQEGKATWMALGYETIRETMRKEI